MSKPKLSLGCGNFGGIGSAPAFFGQGQNEAESFAIMDAAWERGIHWFDTADAYGGGRSESFIGLWRSARRPEGLRVTTKVYNPVSGDPVDRGLGRDRIRREIEGSLARLGVERVDLYLAHEPDPGTPIAETVQAFEELVSEGTIAAWGLSNYGDAEIRGALEHGTPALIQNSYSLLDREDEAAVLPLCARLEIDYIPFGPLSGGWLTGKYTRDAAFPPGSRMSLRPGPYERLVTERVFDGLERLSAEAEAREVDMATLAFAWVLSHPSVGGAVCGPSRPEHLKPVLAALEVPLSVEERDRIGSFFA